MLPPNQHKLILTGEEIQVLTRSPDALGVLVNHYEHREQLARNDGSNGETQAALAARREIIESLLDEAAPSLEARDLPLHLKSSEELEVFDRAQALLFLSDPSQAVGNLRWMLCQVWWRWKGLDLAIRSLRSGPWKNLDSVEVEQPSSAQYTDTSQVRTRIMELDRQLISAGRVPTGLEYDRILKWALSSSDPAVRQKVLKHDQHMRSAGLKPTFDDYQAIFSIVTGLASSLNESPSPAGP